MTVTFEISPEEETELREKMSLHDEEAVRRLLGGVALPVVVTLFEKTTSKTSGLTNAEFEALADAVADIATTRQTPLSDEAVSRAGIYAEHF